MKSIRCAVLGAGPTGLEAALYASTLGFEVSVYESGEEVAPALRDWGHVTMFSPFEMNRSSLGTRMLAWRGCSVPEDAAYLSGREYVESYLKPLSSLPWLDGKIRYGTRVISVGKNGIGKSDWIGQEDRLARPFRIFLEEGDKERVEEADFVLDCTGLYGNPNWLGNGGIPAVGERALRDRIEYRVPDVLGNERAEYAGKTVLLAGYGHSAATTLLGLVALSEEEPETKVIWLTDRDDASGYEEIPDDPLPLRRKIVQKVDRIAERGHEAVKRMPRAFIEELGGTSDGRLRVRVSGENGAVEVDRVIANVGFSPDNSLYSELQVHECYASRGPMKLASALLSANGSSGDCLSVPSFGPEMIKNPEPGFYILGSKSYGKGFNFLLRNGYEQIRDAFALITGRKDLDLYGGSSPFQEETGERESG